MKSPDVIVVGAGVAGLSAAVDLAARGARVTVLEAKAILGGRATAFTDPQTGERVDNGQHVLLGCYEETFAFLRRLGTEGDVRVQPALTVDFVDRAGQRSRLRLPTLPPPVNLAAGLLDWDALSWRDRLAALAARSVQYGWRRKSRERRARAGVRRGLRRLPARRWRSGSSTTVRRRVSARCCGSRWRLPR